MQNLWQVVGIVYKDTDLAGIETWKKCISEALMTTIHRHIGSHGHYEGDREPTITTWHDPMTDCYKVKAVIRGTPIVISRPIFMVSDEDGWPIRHKINVMMYAPYGVH